MARKSIFVGHVGNKRPRGFYDKFHGRGCYLDTHRTNMEKWHGGERQEWVAAIGNPRGCEFVHAAFT